MSELDATASQRADITIHVRPVRGDLRVHAQLGTKRASEFTDDDRVYLGAILDEARTLLCGKR